MILADLPPFTGDLNPSQADWVSRSRADAGTLKSQAIPFSTIHQHSGSRRGLSKLLSALLVGSSAGATSPKEAPWLYPAFPPSCPVRSFRSFVSSARRIARSVRISRTTRPCTLRIKGYGPIRWERFLKMDWNKTLGIYKTDRAFHTAILYSTSSIRNLGAGRLVPSGAESSFQPNCE